MTDDEAGDQAFRAAGTRAHWPEMTYGGALSFLRRRYTRDLMGVDVAVMGVPYDASVTYRPGCRLGPRAIRAASVQLAELKAFPFGFDLFEALSIVDYGDCMVDPHHPQTVVPDIEAAATEILATGAKLLSLGGDHFVTYPLQRAHSAKYGPLALIQVDAHGDLWPDDPGRMDHGTMMGRLVREGLIDTARSTQVGIRTTLRSSPAKQFFTRLSQGTASFVELGWTASPDAWNSLNALFHTFDHSGLGSFNAGRYSNPQVDILIDHIRTEPDATRRRAMVSTVLRLVDEDLPFIPLYRRKLAWAMAKKVSAVQWPNDMIELRWVRVQ